MQKTQEFMGSFESKVRHDWMWMDRHYRERLERGEMPGLNIPYVPTDWSKVTKAEERELMQGYDERNRYCPGCFMLKSLSGECNCG